MSQTIELIFPHNVSVRVASGARLELFPGAQEPLQEEVVYVVGPEEATVRFVVKRAVIDALPESFLALQLRSAFDRERQAVGDGITEVRLSEHAPRLFPLVFGYANALFRSKPMLPSMGLDEADACAVQVLMHDFFQLPRFDSPLVKLAQDARSRASLCQYVRFMHVGGRLSPNPTPFAGRMMATLDRHAVITCTGGGGSVRILLPHVPVAAPWAESLMGDESLEMKKKGREYARKEAKRARTKSQVPDTDDDLLPYPYPVDLKRSFFIPAHAILCLSDRGERIVCEGFIDETHLRIDALDLEKHAWLYLEVKYRMDTTQAF